MCSAIPIDVCMAMSIGMCMALSIAMRINVQGQSRSRWQAMLLETDAQMHKDGKVPLSFPDVQIFLYKVFRGTDTDFARSRIGFYRQSANHFKQDFKNERWLELQSDSSCAIHPELGEVPGWLLVKFAAEKRDGGAQAKRQDYEKREAGKKLQAVMKNAEPYELRAYIFQARGLPINRKGEVPSTFVKGTDRTHAMHGQMHENTDGRTQGCMHARAHAFPHVRLYTRKHTHSVPDGHRPQESHCFRVVLADL